MEVVVVVVVVAAAVVVVVVVMVMMMVVVVEEEVVSYVEFRIVVVVVSCYVCSTFALLGKCAAQIEILAASCCPSKLTRGGALSPQF
jgi:hypothetical protein